MCWNISFENGVVSLAHVHIFFPELRGLTAQQRIDFIFRGTSQGKGGFSIAVGQDGFEALGLPPVRAAHWANRSGGLRCACGGHWCRLLQRQPGPLHLVLDRSLEPTQVLGHHRFRRALAADLAGHLVQQVPHRPGVPGDPVEHIDRGLGLLLGRLASSDVHHVAGGLDDLLAVLLGQRRQGNHLLPQGLERLGPHVEHRAEVAGREHRLEPGQHPATGWARRLGELGFLHGLQDLLGRPPVLGGSSSHVPHHGVVELLAAQGHRLVERELAGDPLLKDILGQAAQGHPALCHPLGHVDVATHHLLGVDAHVAHELGCVPGGALTLGNVLHGADGPGLLSRGRVDLPGQDALGAGPTGQIKPVVTVDHQQLVGLWVPPDADDLAEQRVIRRSGLQRPGGSGLADASGLELQPHRIRGDVVDRGFPDLGVAGHHVAPLSRRHRAQLVRDRAAGLGDRRVDSVDGGAELGFGFGDGGGWGHQWLLGLGLSLFRQPL